MDSFLIILLSALMMTSYQTVAQDRFDFVSYEGFQIFRVKGLEGLQDEEDLMTFLGLEMDNTAEILDGNKLTGTADILVSLKDRSKLLRKLKSGRLDFEVLVENLGQEIKRESLLLRSVAPEIPTTTLSFRKYLNLEQIEEHLYYLQDKFPSKVILRIIGETYEGRYIYMLKISDDITHKWSTKSDDRPVIFVEAGIHAREWISPMATLYLIHKILNTPDLTSTIDWRIVVVTNPDGYAHTWNKVRMWRKNKADIDHYYCMGVDLNRNFEAHFRQTNSRKCKSDYSGERPFSEEESTAIREAVWYIRKRIKGYLSVHSYSQLILHPPGAKGPGTNVPLADKKRFTEMGNLMAEEILKANGVNYTVGSPVEILYSAHGISQDWAYSNAKIPYVFTMELRDKGEEGFLLAPKKILDTSKDLWIAAQMMAGEIVKQNPFAFRANN